MKLLIYFFSLITLACSSGKSLKKTNTLNKIYTSQITFIYQAHSRGFFEEISINEKTVVFLKNRKRKKAVKGLVSLKDWKICIDLFNSIDLSKISQFTAPSNLRKTDRVPYAQLIVIKNGDTIKSNYFDHKNPPQELKQLVNRILCIKENNISI